ncbi:DUF6063 family protein [Turicibacter sanguinis]|uniref:DUF6063 family protein n=1 Tax=Turicibacter sanguinis TaxID=154288 RepID=UPI0021D505C5|nr:DUF6063 family protein [Turicibacter sanguinis]MCU7192175.1 DUF6063 family protein [Turicibacter sanguinis]
MNNNAARAYEFMLKIKQNGFSLSREDDPELYASYNELLDELHTFAKLEKCEFYRSRTQSIIHLIPNNESRYVHSSSALGSSEEMGIGNVAEVFLSDFAVLTLILMFFNPRAVEFRVRKFVSLSEWQEFMTNELERLVSMTESAESVKENGYDLEALSKQWNAKANMKQSQDKNIKGYQTKRGFLIKVGQYLVREKLLIAEKPKNLEDDEVVQIDYYPTPRFEDLSEYLLRKQSTLSFLNQLQAMED